MRPLSAWLRPLIPNVQRIIATACLSWIFLWVPIGDTYRTTGGPTLTTYYGPPGKLLSLFTISRGIGSGVGSNEIRVEWPAMLACLAVLHVLYCVLDNSSRHLGSMQTRRLFFACVAVGGGSGVVAAMIYCRSTFGYWVSIPAIDPVISHAKKISSMVFWESDRWGRLVESIDSYSDHEGRDLDPTSTWTRTAHSLRNLINSQSFPKFAPDQSPTLLQDIRRSISPPLRQDEFGLLLEVETSDNQRRQVLVRRADRDGPVAIADVAEYVFTESNGVIVYHSTTQFSYPTREPWPPRFDPLDLIARQSTQNLVFRPIVIGLGSYGVLGGLVMAWIIQFALPLTRRRLTQARGFEVTLFR